MLSYLSLTFSPSCLPSSLLPFPLSISQPPSLFPLIPPSLPPSPSFLLHHSLPFSLPPSLSLPSLSPSLPLPLPPSLLRENDRLEHMWTFEGHQLGIVSVTTDVQGQGTVEPLNIINDTLGPAILSFIERLSSFGGIGNIGH